jgi:hypothetical protein
LEHFFSGMTHSYQVRYQHASSGAIGVVIISTAAKAEEEKRRLEDLGYTVSAIVPSQEDEAEPVVVAPRL